MNKKLRVMLKDMENALSRQFPNRHFADGQFLEDISPIDSSLMDNFLKESSLNGQFPEQTFPR